MSKTKGKSNMSPMMEQYLRTKEEYDDCILFYRLGDFYEVFFDDAVLVSKLCELVLTSKACGGQEKAPMCGVPFHALDSYLAQLVGVGYKIAIAEQMADPSTIKKGLVPRDVVRIVTPGTVTSSGILSEKNNNYIISLYFDNTVDAAWCDLSTGEFKAKAFEVDSIQDDLMDTLTLIRPCEIITNATKDDISWLWEYAEIADIMISCANKRMTFENNAPSLLISYLRDTQKQDINHLDHLRMVTDSSHMKLDRSSLRNLELTETIFGKGSSGSLVGVLDKCKTAMGSRKLQQWIKEPLTDKSLIESRLDAVEVLVDAPLVRNNLRALLSSIYDLERLMSRISLGRTSVKDLLALKQSVAMLPDIKAELENVSNNEYIQRVNNKISSLEDVYTMIDNAIIDSQETQPQHYGNLIKPGFSKELDAIHESVKDSQEWLDNLEEEEKKRTGIKNLRTGFNKVFGYYIEVSKSQVPHVPDDYIRKQTMKTGERYVTQKLEEIESIVLGAQSKIDALEKKLFDSVREFIESKISTIQQTAMALSVLDVICDFAEVSFRNGYVKPQITKEDAIIVKQGRHPVVETSTANVEFVPNDVYIDKNTSSLLLITGPNMSGKSTYMRQLSLIVIMAQAGCFVPATSAEIGICDRIYTRIGAADNISMGQSTFFVEMVELANILNTATPKSLVILDEIGRGTSTFDGLSIAWSTVEFLTHNHIRTMFATHYHELTNIDNIDGIKNLNVEVDERDNEIEFTYKIADGPASQSYGIQVAKLAGVPNSVLDRAREILKSLEEDK